MKINITLTLQELQKNNNNKNNTLHRIKKRVQPHI